MTDILSTTLISHVNYTKTKYEMIILVKNKHKIISNDALVTLYC